MRYLAVLLLAFGACSPLTNLPGGYVSHALPNNMHTCPGGAPPCREGEACTKDGCEWCGDDVVDYETRCSAGDD